MAGLAGMPLHKRLLRKLWNWRYELFGASTVIFVSIPFSNNVRTMNDADEWKRKNDMIRFFCHNYVPPINQGVQHVLIQEFRVGTDLMRM